MWPTGGKGRGGGVSWLHSADEDAVSWLTSYGSTRIREEEEMFPMQKFGREPVSCFSLSLSPMHLSLFRYMARMDDDTDAKKILFALSPESRKGPPGRPCITRLKTVHNDVKFHNFTLTETLDVTQNHPGAHSGGCWQRLALHTLVV